LKFTSEKIKAKPFSNLLNTAAEDTQQSVLTECLKLFVQARNYPSFQFIIESQFPDPDEYREQLKIKTD
jgi:hypothetical protein